MDLTPISNPTVRRALEALQAGDKAAWYACFTPDATFTDDGKRMDFRSFFDNAFTHKEKFLEIDTVADGGKHIHGKFYAGQWGTFRVFFKFHVDGGGAIERLDIGQAG
jgi:ketosteroid isomerase-like protein